MVVIGVVLGGSAVQLLGFGLRGMKLNREPILAVHRENLHEKGETLTEALNNPFTEQRSRVSTNRFIEGEGRPIR
jgi:hypothetical protein